jgi:hypothetical protein
MTRRVISIIQPLTANQLTMGKQNDARNQVFSSILDLEKQKKKLTKLHDNPPNSQ